MSGYHEVSKGRRCSSVGSQGADQVLRVVEPNNNCKHHNGNQTEHRAAWPNAARILTGKCKDQEPQSRDASHGEQEGIVRIPPAIKQHTLEVGDIYTSPVIAMEKISQAHDDLLEALQIASRLRQEGIESARVNIAELARLSAQLEEKIGGVIGNDEIRLQSLEDKRNTN